MAMETLNTQQPRTINNAVPLESEELLTMNVKGIRYYVRPITGFTGYFASTCGAVISCVSGFNGKRQRLDKDQPKLLRQFDTVMVIYAFISTHQTVIESISMCIAW